jgi:hypothetical protein
MASRRRRQSTHRNDYDDEIQRPAWPPHQGEVQVGSSRAGCQSTRQTHPQRQLDSGNQTPTPDSSPHPGRAAATTATDAATAVPLTGQQNLYTLHLQTHIPERSFVGALMSLNGLQLQVRSRDGITDQIRQDLALGRLFAITTILPNHHDQDTQGTAAPDEQSIAAVAPVPALDFLATHESPPPPFVLGTLTFKAFTINSAGNWRIRVTLLRMESAGHMQDGAVSVGYIETSDILVA